MFPIINEAVQGSLAGKGVEEVKLVKTNENWKRVVFVPALLHLRKHV